MLERELQKTLASIAEEFFVFVSGQGEKFAIKYALQLETINISNNPIRGENIQEAYNFVYGAVVLLVTLKFLWKGFNVYVLLRNGDSDVSPRNMVRGGICTVLYSLAFPLLYPVMVHWVQFMADGLIDILVLGIGPPEDFREFIESYTLGWLFVLLAFIIITLIVSIMMIKRGGEVLVLRLGIPIAALGLIDSDSGIWKSYMSLLLRQMATSIVQAVCFSLGLRLMYAGEPLAIIMGIAIELLAVGAPKLMAQIMAPSGGGGGMQTIYAVSSVTRLLVH